MSSMKNSILLLVIVFLFVGCQADTSDFNELEMERDDLEQQLSGEISKSASLEDKLETAGQEIEVLNQEILDLNEELEMALEEESEPLTLSSSGQLIAAGLEVIELIKTEDYAALSGWVHPTLGVRFSPYFYVNANSDIVMTPNDIANIASDTSVYNWGAYDGTGDPIDLTFADYYDRFIYDQDYANPEVIGNNNAIQVGNMLDNHDDVYPNGDFVEFHFSGFDPQFSGMDWRSLRLVFVEDGGQLYLVGLVHGEWTI